MKRRPDEDGFTLIELLIAMVIGTTLLGVVGSSFILALRASDGVDERLAESHDTQLLATTLSADLQSVSESGVDTAAGSATGCAGASPGQNVLRLQWSENLLGGVTNFVASYRYLQSGSEWQLVRYYCEGADLASATPKTTVVAHELSPTVNPTAVGSGVDRGLQITLASGYTFTITGSRRTPAATSTTTSTTLPGSLRALQSASIRDNDLNGKVDQIVASFSGALDAGCNTGWSSSVLPAVATLGAVSISGSNATITVNPGATFDTAWTGVTISIAPSGSCNAAAGTVTRTDLAAPVVVSVSSGTLTAGQIQTLDTLTFTLSEPVSGVPVSGTITETDDKDNDTLSIAGLLSGPANMGSKNYVDKSKSNTTATFASAITNVAGVIQVVVGASTCGTSCATILTGSGNITFTFVSSIQDAASQSIVAKSVTGLAVF